MLSLLRTAIHGLHRLKMLAPTMGALIGAVVSGVGVPGAIVGAALAAAIAKSFADDWAAVQNLQFRIKD